MQVIGMYLWGLRGRDFSTAKGLKSAEVLHQIYPAGLPTATRALFARGAFRRMPTPEVCIAEACYPQPSSHSGAEIYEDLKP